MAWKYNSARNYEKDEWHGHERDARASLGIVEKIKRHGMGTSVTLAPAWGLLCEPMVGGELHRTCREVHEFLLTKN